MTTRLRTWVLIAGLSALFVSLGAFVGGTGGLVLFLVIAVGFNFAMYWFSDRIALKVGRAVPLERSEAPEIYADVEDLAQRAGLPVPRLYRIPSEQPNAFATGRSPKHSAVAVTEGLMQRPPPRAGSRRARARACPRAEQGRPRDDGCGHDRSRDHGSRSLPPVQLAVRRRRGREPLGIVGTIAAILIAPIAAMILQLAVSRQREYLADATAAELLGEGRPLAYALESLQRGVAAVPVAVNPATASLYIANPSPGRGWARSSRRSRRWRPGSTRLRAIESSAPATSGSTLSRLARGRPPTPCTAGGLRTGAANRSVAATQEALYQAHDLELSWSEASLPERERTKHVHRLHPYLGKFIPQLVETLLDRHVPAGGRVLDPFAGSGTTLVQALESGYDATGVDIAGFNALLARVKTRPYNLEALRRDLLWAHTEAEAFQPRGRYPRGTTAYVRAWFAPAAAEELLHFRSLVEQVGSADVLRIVLARSARSARRTAHFDLEFPREPQLEPYWCSSTGASASRSNRPAGSCCVTRSTRWSGSRRSRPCAQTDASPECCTATPA